MDKKKTGELIKKARSEKGYTQNELGDLIGVSNKAVSRWENGDSFPDIGVLENLSKILGLRIQDMVIGEIEESNNDNAVIEIVRVAKIQENEKNRKYRSIFVGLSLICYLFFRGYWGLSESMSGKWLTSLDYYFLAAILIIISIKCISGKETMNPFRDNVSKFITIVGIVTGLYVIISMYLTIWIVGQGKTPFNMDSSLVGPFVNNQLIAIFIVNFITVLIDYFRMSRREISIHAGMYLPMAVLHIVFVYSDMLHELSTQEEFYRIFILDTVVVIAETVIILVITSIIKKCIKAKQYIMK